jgi:hypothetical protein
MAIGPVPARALGFGGEARSEGFAAICNKLLISLLPTIEVVGGMLRWAAKYGWLF